jgi:hypothetical protein
MAMATVAYLRYRDAPQAMAWAGGILHKKRTWRQRGAIGIIRLRPFYRVLIARKTNSTLPCTLPYINVRYLASIPP